MRSPLEALCAADKTNVCLYRLYLMSEKEFENLWLDLYPDIDLIAKARIVPKRKFRERLCSPRF